jgi:hypothetical protein
MCSGLKRDLLMSAEFANLTDGDREPLDKGPRSPYTSAR